MLPVSHFFSSAPDIISQMLLPAKQLLLIPGIPVCSLAVHLVVSASFWRCGVHPLHCPGETSLHQV